MIVMVFSTHTCHPCENLKSHLDRINLKDGYKVVYIDDNASFCTTYNIMSVPTLIIFDDDYNVIARMDGYAPKKLESILANHGVEF